MKNMMYPRKGTEGRLPSMAPLANPYVPFQMEDAPRYEPRKALVRGTLYEGLDLPFMGMVNQTEKPVTPMSELQTMSFALQELYAQCRERYEKECGPLTHMSPAADAYKWLCDPWPWEYAMNREV